MLKIYINICISKIYYCYQCTVCGHRVVGLKPTRFKAKFKGKIALQMIDLKIIHVFSKHVSDNFPTKYFNLILLCIVILVLFVFVLFFRISNWQDQKICLISKSNLNLRENVDWKFYFLIPYLFFTKILFSFFSFS